MLVMVVNLTAFAVVREREIGTLEQIMVTPIAGWNSSWENPPVFPDRTLGCNACVLGRHALVRRSLPREPWVLAGGGCPFILCMLGIGLFISTVSMTQQQAMVSGFFFIMPAITFSGFGFPISSMPEFMQWLTYLDPLRYFLDVLRGVYLKGVGLDVLWPQMAAMALLALVMLTFSVARFRKSLD